MAASWKTLPLGAGGLCTGLHIANDGSMVCRTDVGNIYRWSGLTTDYADATKKWVPLLTNASLNAAVGGIANRGGNDLGGWEHVLAPGSSNVHVAIFPDMSPAGNVYGTWLWYSTDSGATWNQTNIAFASGTAQSNGPPGGNTKTCAYKIAIDPANPNVAYCGMPAASGNTAGVYTSLNQAGGSTLATWASVKTSGSTPIPANSYGISCGIIIDPSLGTTTVGGQTVTKHIILPVGGAGIYESKDGGVTFTEVALTPFGASVWHVICGGCNFDGVYYCIAVQPTVNAAATASWTTSNSTITMVANPGIVPGMTIVDTNSGLTVGTVLTYVGTTLTLTANALHAGSSGDTLQFTPPASPDVRGIWRYVPGSPGTWTNITSGTYATNNFAPSQAFLCVDSRNIAGSKTYLAVFGPQGIGAGFSTTNANSGSPTWTGFTGGETVNLRAASYDIGYINSIFGQGVSGFANATAACIDANGVCWWPGNQSVFYLGSSTSVTTPTTTGGPTYSNTPGSFYSWSMGRGQEATVGVDVLCPPGGTYPVLGLHDIGAPVRGTFTSYPLTVASPFLEYACTNLEYAADDSSFIVARVTAQLANTDASCYSTNYGADGSWSTIAAYPTSLWSGQAIEGGILVAADKDHWITIPNGFGAAIQPAYTTNARSTATWALCSGLPSADWWSEPWFFGTYTPKQLAVGYGADLGTVWACLITVGNSTATLYRSTDYGQTFSSVKTWAVGTSAYSSYCLSVPGFSNELWVTSRFTNSTGAGLWHITNANTASPNTPVSINLPANITAPVAFTLGAPSSPGGYPTLYLFGGTGFGTTQYLYQGTYPGSGSTVTWALFGTSGQTNGINPDLPASCQLAGIQSIRGDWNVYQRLYVSSQDSGFAFFGDISSTGQTLYKMRIQMG